jgi:hypothetical protein
MRISQQIGWSQESKLIYQIVQQTERVNQILPGSQAGFNVPVSKQIGWSNESSLYYQWLLSLSKLTSHYANCCTPTTTTTTTAAPLALRLTFNSIENANTLVGDASNVVDWNTFFELPTYGSPFTSVAIDGNTVILTGGSNIETKFRLFTNTQSLLEVDDDGALVILGDESFGGTEETSVLERISCPNVIRTKYLSDSNYGVFGGCYNLVYANLPKLKIMEGCEFYACQSLPNNGLILPFSEITSLGKYTFQDCEQLSEISFPNVISVDDSCFYNMGYSNPLPTTFNLPNLVTTGPSCFDQCINLTSISLPNLITAGYGCFLGCTYLTTVDLPKVETIGGAGFLNCYSLVSLSIPSCTNLGLTVLNDAVFSGITGNTITLTVPSALMTCNAGDPDGDIQYLQANNTVTVITV